MERRNFLARMGNTAFGALARRMGLRTAPDNPKADIEIHITPVEIEVAPRRIYVEPKEERGNYDAEVFLALHGWAPHLDVPCRQNHGLGH
jgi:hypothetical protein